MARYYIDYNTGAGNEWVEGTLAHAKRVADKGAAYTQQHIYIYEYDDSRTSRALVAARKWYWHPSDIGQMRNPIAFGDSGYYGDWESYSPDWENLLPAPEWADEE